MVSKAYVICEVELKKESMLFILCSSWLIQPDSDETSQSYCLWPINEELVYTLVQIGHKPESNWIQYKCKILFECSTYEVARLKLKMLLISKDCNKKKIESTITNESKKEKENDYQKQKTIPYKCKYTLQKENKSEVNHYTNNLVQKTFKESILNLSNINAEIQNKCSFPLQTLSDVVEIEKKLKDSESNYLIIKMRLWQCLSYKKVNDTVTSMLQILFSDKCAQNYTFDGKNNLKDGFKDLVIYSIILNVVLKFHKDKTEDDVELQTRKWLRLAPLRVKNREMSKIKLKYCPLCKMV